MEEHSVVESFEMKLSESAKDFLKETAKWAYFLSILGFIGIGFIIFAALFAGTLFSSMSKMNPAMGAMGSSFGIVIAFVYFLIAVLYFFPVYYLNKFASNAKRAFKNNDSETLTTALEYLKSHYKYIGIMTLVVFSLYFLMFIGMIVAGMSFNNA
jgi:large-conductance mechanosensitive channel